MKKIVYSVFTIIFMIGMLTFCGCNKKNQPVVKTIGVSDITSTTAKFNAVIVNEGNERIVSSGFYYSTDQSMNNKQTAQCNGYKSSEFSVTVSNLQSNTTYYYQAYAINGKGTGIGEVMSFTTEESSSGGNNGSANSPITITDNNGASQTSIDLSSADNFHISFFGNANIPRGIANISCVRLNYSDSNNIASSVVVNCEYHENRASYIFEVIDDLTLSDLNGIIRLVYRVSITDNDNVIYTAEYTVYITNPVRPLSNWSETIYLTYGQTLSSINGISVTETENQILGVRMTPIASSEYEFAIGHTNNCDGFVIVNNTNYTTGAQLEYEYTNGNVVPEIVIWENSYDYYGKSFSPITFISKIGNTYNLVNVVCAIVSPYGYNNVNGTIIGFQYKSTSNTSTNTSSNYTEGTFEWVKQGANIPDLSVYGLQWSVNTREVHANIKPLSGASLYILSAYDYTSNFETLNTILSNTTEASEYNGVSAMNSADYNDVIATIYNGKTCLINIKRGDVTSTDMGTQVTITGTYKMWTPTR